MADLWPEPDLDKLAVWSAERYRITRTGQNSAQNPPDSYIQGTRINWRELYAWLRTALGQPTTFTRREVFTILGHPGTGLWENDCYWAGWRRTDATETLAWMKAIEQATMKAEGIDEAFLEGERQRTDKPRRISRDLIGAVIEWLREEPTLLLEAELDGGWVTVSYAQTNGQAQQEPPELGREIPTLDRVAAQMNHARLNWKGQGKRPQKGEAAYHATEHVNQRYPGLIKSKQDAVDLVVAAGYKKYALDGWADLLRYGAERTNGGAICRFCENTP